MVAHYHGQTWNGAEISRSLGVSQTTVRNYLDALTDALVLRQLPPWFAIISNVRCAHPRSTSETPDSSTDFSALLK